MANDEKKILDPKQVELTDKAEKESVQLPDETLDAVSGGHMDSIDPNMFKIGRL